MNNYITLVFLLLSLVLVTVTLLLLRKAWRYYRVIKTVLESKSTIPKKPRKRYIIFTVISTSKLSIKEIEDSVRTKFAELYGKSSLFKASPRLVFFDEVTGRGVFRVTHTYVNHLVASMGLVKEISGVDCLIIPLRTTGTLKKARKYMEKIEI